MERKTVAFKVTDFDFEGRTMEGYAAAFGNRDRAGDVIHPGAFRKTLAERGGKVRFLWQHDPGEPLGRPLEMHEDEKGLFVRAAVSDTARGRDALALLKDGAIGGLSIGYDPVKGGTDYTKDETTGDTTRNLRELKLWEFSLATFPANEDAHVTAVKQDPAPAEGKPAPDVTENTIRIRVRDPDDFQPNAFGDDGKFRTITIGDKGKGIQAVVGKPKGETTTRVQSYVFDKEKWTVARAQAWVDEHKKDAPPDADEKQATEDGAGALVPTGEQPYVCECVDCGHKMLSAEHCSDLKCPECGGQMRRAERPGPGKNGDQDGEMEYKGITDEDKRVIGRELRALNMTDLVANHRRLHQMAARGSILTGFTRADMNWFHAAVEAELRRRAEEADRKPSEATPLEWGSGKAGEGEPEFAEDEIPEDDEEKHMVSRIGVIRRREEGKGFDPDVETKVGRVLSAANAGKLVSALTTIMDVLERAGIDVPGYEKQPSKKPPKEEGKKDANDAPADEKQAASEDRTGEQAGPSPGQAPTPDGGAGPQKGTPTSDWQIELLEMEHELNLMQLEV